VGKRSRICSIHDLSSSRKTVRPPWLSEVHMRLSWPRPKTRKLHGDFLARILAETEISLKVCCGVMFVVA